MFVCCQPCMYNIHLPPCYFCASSPLLASHILISTEVPLSDYAEDLRSDGCSYAISKTTPAFPSRSEEDADLKVR